MGRSSSSSSTSTLTRAGSDQKDAVRRFQSGSRDEALESMSWTSLQVIGPEARRDEARVQCQQRSRDWLRQMSSSLKDRSQSSVSAEPSPSFSAVATLEFRAGAYAVMARAVGSRARAVKADRPPGGEALTARSARVPHWMSNPLWGFVVALGDVVGVGPVVLLEVRWTRCSTFFSPGTCRGSAAQLGCWSSLRCAQGPHEAVTAAARRTQSVERPP